MFEMRLRSSQCHRDPDSLICSLGYMKGWKHVYLLSNCEVLKDSAPASQSLQRQLNCMIRPVSSGPRAAANYFTPIRHGFIIPTPP